MTTYQIIVKNESGDNQKYLFLNQLPAIQGAPAKGLPNVWVKSSGMWDPPSCNRWSKGNLILDFDLLCHAVQVILHVIPTELTQSLGMTFRHAKSPRRTKLNHHHRHLRHVRSSSSAPRIPSTHTRIRYNHRGRYGCLGRNISIVGARWWWPSFPLTIQNNLYCQCFWYPDGRLE